MKKSFLKSFLIALTEVVLLVFFNHWSGQGLKSSVLSVFKKPLTVSHSFLGQTKQRVVSWFSTGELLRENESLKEENRRLVAANLKIYELEQENDFLRKELGVVERKNYTVAMARVFHQQFDGQFQTALIDIGNNEGVKSNMPVVFDGEIIYGVVKEVYPASALVYLITDPRLTISVKIKETEVMGKSRGALAEGLFLELVANQEEAQAGNLVITSGLDGLPSALIVGKIKTVKTDRGGIFKEIKINPEFQSLTVDRVFVLKNESR